LNPYSATAATDKLRTLLSTHQTWHPIQLRSDPELLYLNGLDLPRRVGGQDLSSLEMALTFRHFGRLDMELRDLAGAGHARLLNLNSSRTFDDVLRSVAEGKAYCGIAVTEPTTGSDLNALSTNASRDDEGFYSLNGRKTHVSRLSEASHFIVLAAVNRQGTGSPITAFLVPRANPGISVTVSEPAGLGRVSWGSITFENVRLPASARIGGEGKGIALFQRHFSYWRTMMAAAAIGCAEAAIDEAIQHLKDRNSFGAPIGRFTHLQQALAKHAAQLRMAWLLVKDVASLMDSKDGGSRPWPVFDAAMAKAEAVEIALDAAEWSLGVFGGAAYETGNGINKRFRDLLGMRFADGTTDVLRGQVARSMVGERLYELSLNRNEKLNDEPHRYFW
jgi:alkylation response protein AidB-like acyl-CoA dehydrogenase